MRKLSFEMESSYDETPIVVFVEGTDPESAVENAQWCYDVPDPSRYYTLGDLPWKKYEQLEQRIREEFNERIAGGNG